MSIRLNGSTSGYTEIDAPAVAGSNTIVLPSGNGSANQLLKNGSTAGSLEFSSSVYIDSSQRLLVGTSSAFNNAYTDPLKFIAVSSTYSQGLGAGFYHFQNDTNSPGLSLGKSRNSTVGSHTVVQNGDSLGYISFDGSDGTTFKQAASISAGVDGTPGTNDMPGRLVFSTTADGASSPTEQMRITSGGLVLIGATSFPGVGTSTTGVGFGTSGSISAHRTAATTCYFGRSNDGEVVALYSGTSQRGYISISGATTTYGSVSDYRLKENIAPISNAADKVSSLKPSRFNFVEFPEQTVDGFIAHEVQDIVPEAVTGAKDQIDADGNPVYQGIDQSKLVPLLTAALQEALAKIDALETRITALEVTP